MSLLDKSIHKAPEIFDFYSDRIKSFGNSSKGVGWKDNNAQEIRFAQLLKVVQNKTGFSINDFGCGAAQLYNYMLAQGYNSFEYYGYDILDEMLQSARNNIIPDHAVILAKIESASEMNFSDYSVASGTFNVKGQSTNEDWLDYIISTLLILNEKSRKGFAFNLLTKYSDVEFMQDHLYYADPLFLFDYCKRNFSKNVALLHDYFQYDFTIIVRKD
ncbi:MAG: methyltransferase domain-containing protein [Bacteroidetes bacterium]|nr:methyltransferase domain-containing protein [Bacteroidota bacterium]